MSELREEGRLVRVRVGHLTGARGVRCVGRGRRLDRGVAQRGDGGGHILGRGRRGVNIVLGTRRVVPVPLSGIPPGILVVGRSRLVPAFELVDERGEPPEEARVRAGRNGGEVLDHAVAGERRTALEPRLPGALACLREQRGGADALRAAGVAPDALEGWACGARRVRTLPGCHLAEDALVETIGLGVGESVSGLVPGAAGALSQLARHGEARGGLGGPGVAIEREEQPLDWDLLDGAGVVVGNVVAHAVPEEGARRLELRLQSFALLGGHSRGSPAARRRLASSRILSACANAAAWAETDGAAS